MEAGKLDRLVTLQRATVTTDAFGAEVQTWADRATVSASAEPISDGERWRAAEVGATVTMRFQIRWGIGVLVTDRLLYEGRAYEIVGVKELERRAGVEISAAARGEG